MKPKWRNSAGGLRIDPNVVCYVCGFQLPRHRAVKVETPVGASWRHKEVHLCDRLMEQLELHTKLVGDTDEKAREDHEA